MTIYDINKFNSDTNKNETVFEHSEAKYDTAKSANHLIF